MRLTGSHHPMDCEEGGTEEVLLPNYYYYIILNRSFSHGCKATTSLPIITIGICINTTPPGDDKRIPSSWVPVTFPRSI